MGTNCCEVFFSCFPMFSNSVDFGNFPSFGGMFNSLASYSNKGPSEEDPGVMNDNDCNNWQLTIQGCPPVESWL